MLQAFRAYIAEQGDKDKIANRVEFIVSEIENSDPGKGPVPSWMRLKIEADLRDHERHFERFKEKFLMEDLYPENRGRSTVKFSDVVSK